MKGPNKATGPNAKTGSFVLGSKLGAKISAVEGMKLTKRMEGVVRQASGRSLSGDERRTMVKEALRKK